MDLFCFRSKLAKFYLTTVSLCNYEDFCNFYTKSNIFNKLCKIVIFYCQHPFNYELSVFIFVIVMDKSMFCTLKSDSHLPNIFIIICFNDSSSKIMKNAFYFILKAYFVLKIFKSLPWLFGHVEKMAWLER